MTTETQNLSLTEAIEIFYTSMDGIRAVKTVRFYRDRLPSLIAHFGEDYPANQVRLDQLRCWRSTLANNPTRYAKCHYRPPVERKLSVYTLHQYIRSAKRLFRWLYMEALIDTNPAARLELPPLPKGPGQVKSIPEKDVLKLLETAEHPRDRAIILLLCDSAARVGGIAALTLDDIDLDQKLAIVHEKGQGGARKYRPIFFCAETAQALTQWLAERKARPGVEALFTNKNGKPLSEWGIREVLRRLAARTGVKRYNPHAFRHGAIRAMLNDGLSLPAASQIAGHSSVVVTGDIYGRVSETELRALHNRHSWVKQIVKKQKK